MGIEQQITQTLNLNYVYRLLDIYLLNRSICLNKYLYFRDG